LNLTPAEQIKVWQGPVLFGFGLANSTPLGAMRAVPIWSDAHP